MLRMLIVGPTSAPWSALADEITADLARLARPGIVLEYRCTGGGPTSIRDVADAAAAAPFVVRTVQAAAGEGFDAVIVDCTEDPGVATARGSVPIPVIGPGEAMAAAVAAARPPIHHFTGDELRRLGVDDLVRRSSGARTVALGGTGFSHIADGLADAHPEIVVLDPLAVALDACLAEIARRRPDRGLVGEPAATGSPTDSLDAQA